MHQAFDNDRAPSESAVAEERGAAGESGAEALEDVVLHTSNQFYRWHTELEAARTSETEEKYRQYAATLTGHLQACDDLIGKVATSWAWFTCVRP